MRYLLLFVLLAYISPCYAQRYTDTLTTGQLESLKQNNPPNTFASRRILFKYAVVREQNKDSAEKYIEYISPYELAWEGISEKQLDWWLKTLPISDEVSEKYREKYISAIANRSESYLAFEQMHHERMAVVERYSKCRGTDSCFAIADELFAVDTAQVSYLYTYVSKHGWPSLDEGGLYAEEIVTRDMGRIDYYLPRIKEKVAAGHASPNIYHVMYYWKGNQKQREFRNWLDTVECARYNVDFLMERRVDRIVQSQTFGYVNDSCPVKLYYVLENAGEDQKARIEGLLTAKYNDGKNVIERFEEKMARWCDTSFAECAGACGEFHYFPSLFRRPTLWLYIVPVGDINIRRQIKKAPQKAEP